MSLPCSRKRVSRIEVGLCWTGLGGAGAVAACEFGLSLAGGAAVDDGGGGGMAVDVLAAACWVDPSWTPFGLAIAVPLTRDGMGVSPVVGMAGVLRWSGLVSPLEPACTSSCWRFRASLSTVTPDCCFVAEICDGALWVRISFFCAGSGVSEAVFMVSLRRKPLESVLEDVGSFTMLRASLNRGSKYS